jgi:hypothetical protein
MKRLVSRRSLSGFLALLAVGLLASGCDWSQFGFSSSHNGDNAFETSISPANASTLTLKFTSLAGTGPNGPIAAEAEVNGVLFAASYSIPLGFGFAPTLYAFSADGTTGCGSGPMTCAALWTASLGTNDQFDYTLAVSNGVVYVNGGPGLEAFDAAGHTNCSGTPDVCQPLWQASVTWNDGAPTVSNGAVFVTSNGDLEAFDASGNMNCSGTPKVCSPIWISHISSNSTVVTVSNGIAYVLSNSGGTFGTVVALDANGNSGCTGAPKVCAPLWEYALIDQASESGNYVSVSGSTLYVGNSRVVSIHPLTIEGSLQAFDANGADGCSGTPKICSPVWTSPTPSGGPPVVGDGFSFPPPVGSTPFAAFDANGSKRWTSSIPATPLAIGGSVLYASDSSNVYAFDANGSTGCTNSACSPLWSTNRPNGSVVVQNAIVANGMLYVATQETSGIGEILAYGLQ